MFYVPLCHLSSELTHPSLEQTSSSSNSNKVKQSWGHTSLALPLVVGINSLARWHSVTVCRSLLSPGLPWYSLSNQFQREDEQLGGLHVRPTRNGIQTRALRFLARRANHHGVTVRAEVVNAERSAHLNIVLTDHSL